jgi:hypothetical protein
MQKVTVNYLLAMDKSLRERLSQLNELKTQSARRTIFDENKREEPTYDIKSVDKKITAINKALFEINHKVKESNAKTVIDTDISYDNLVSELE